ncbi:MAG: CPn0927/CPn0928 family alpha/beta hydrolase fold protein [Chlamydiales bacterium]
MSSGVSSNAIRVPSFRDVVHGQNAFYHAPDYLQSTARDLAAEAALPTSYVWNTEYKIIRIVKRILSIVIFPIIIYKLLHALAGKIALLPASNPRFFPENHANESRRGIALEGEWKYKRITVEVDDYKIDATIVGKASTLGNRRWVLASNGNGEFYENKLANNSEFTRILTQVNGNAIVFNYPGVGASLGLPNRQAMAKAYKAMLALLEDQHNGIGAREIIGYGHSIGGGVQGDALRTHRLQQGIRYVFVKSRTFSSLAATASIITGKPFLGFLVRFLGWNMDSVESSKRLQAPEIIMQTARAHGALADSSGIIHDEVIPAETSLARALLDDNACPRSNKAFIGIRENHNQPLRDPSFLARSIEGYLVV